MIVTYREIVEQLHIHQLAVSDVLNQWQNACERNFLEVEWNEAEKKLNNIEKRYVLLLKNSARNYTKFLMKNEGILKAHVVD